MTLLINHTDPRSGELLHQFVRTAQSLKGINTPLNSTEIVDENGRLICRPMDGCRVEIVLHATPPLTMELRAALEAALNR